MTLIVVAFFSLQISTHFHELRSNCSFISTSPCLSSCHSFVFNKYFLQVIQTGHCTKRLTTMLKRAKTLLTPRLMFIQITMSWKPGCHLWKTLFLLLMMMTTTTTAMKVMQTFILKDRLMETQDKQICKISSTCLLVIFPTAPVRLVFACYL